jgi:hypothetical protein
MNHIGGGALHVENACPNFRCVGAFMLPVGVGKTEINSNRKEFGPHGQ